MRLLPTLILALTLTGCTTTLAEMQARQGMSEESASAPESTETMSAAAAAQVLAGAACDAAVECSDDPNVLDAFCASDAFETNGCTYDPDYAELCSEDAWTCEEAAGLKIPVPPMACEFVFTDCPVEAEPEPEEEETSQGPTRVDGFHTDCEGQVWELEARLTPGATNVTVEMADTRNASVGVWSEEHRLHDAGTGAWSVALDAVNSLAVDPSETVFACDQRISMTYVVRAYDGDELLDCVATGEDPHGLLNGDYDGDLFAPIRDASELSSCDTW